MKCVCLLYDNYKHIDVKMRHAIIEIHPMVWIPRIEMQ